MDHVACQAPRNSIELRGSPWLAGRDKWHARVIQEIKHVRIFHFCVSQSRYRALCCHSRCLCVRACPSFSARHLSPAAFGVRWCTRSHIQCRMGVKLCKCVHPIPMDTLAKFHPHRTSNLALSSPISLFFT